MLALVIAAPLAALVFGWLGGKVGLATMDWHPDGELAALVALEEAGALEGDLPDELTAYRQHGAKRAEVLARATVLEERAFALGSVIGALFGLVLALKAGRAFFPESSPDYETDRGRCLSCARCFSACPYELVRRGIPVELPPEGARNA
jgi:hypothetical protein